MATLQGKEFWQGGNLYKTYGAVWLNITGIIHSKEKPSDENMAESHLWSTNNSPNDVYFWIDASNKLYWWSEANNIKLNSDCTQMFNGWSNLNDISGLSNFDASEVENMNMMFCNTSISNLSSIKDWNTSNVKNMSQVFANCNSLTSVTEIKDWNVSNVENMYIMFSNCAELTDIDLSQWDTNKVTNMEQMFQGSNKLTTIYASNKFTTTSVTNSTNMFLGCTSLVGGNSTIYDSSKVDKTYAHIDGGASNPGYFTVK